MSGPSPSPGTGPTFTSVFEIRYGEVDLQGVVFNAHYLAYCDHTSDSWLRSVGFSSTASGWDMMVKHVEMTWHSSAMYGEALVVEARVERFGDTSMTMAFAGSVRDAATVIGRHIFDAEVTYVGVEAGTKLSARVPDWLRSSLS